MNSGGRDLKDGAGSVETALNGCAVEVSGAVDGKFGIGVFAVGSASEAIDKLVWSRGPRC